MVFTRVTNTGWSGGRYKIFGCTPGGMFPLFYVFSLSSIDPFIPRGARDKMKFSSDDSKKERRILRIWEKNGRCSKMPSQMFLMEG